MYLGHHRGNPPHVEAALAHPIDAGEAFLDIGPDWLLPQR